MAYNLLRLMGSDNVVVGAIALGAACPVQILLPLAAVRRLVDIATPLARGAKLR